MANYPAPREPDPAETAFTRRAWPNRYVNQTNVCSDADNQTYQYLSVSACWSTHRQADNKASNTQVQGVWRLTVVFLEPTRNWARCSVGWYRCRATKCPSLYANVEKRRMVNTFVDRVQLTVLFVSLKFALYWFVVREKHCSFIEKYCWSSSNEQGCPQQYPSAT
jgi:hypothetical protein